MGEKIELSAERLYIMRATYTHTDGRIEVRYYETPSMWNKSPMEATIFQNYESGEGHLNRFVKRDKAKGGWFDGRKEVLEIVPLYGEILQSPNAKRIEVRRK